MARPSGARREGAGWVGQTIARRYRVESLVARGGMGDVFRATQEPLGRRVAVKTFRTLGELDGHADAGALFLREAAALAGVRHDNAVEIYDYGTYEGTPFLVMEWLEGESLARALEREGCVAPMRALRVVGKVLGALERVHELGMVHRDVKPENIMLVAGQNVKLIDFGLVKWDSHGPDAYAVEGVVVGSTRYMAPEQIVDSRGVGHRADLYAIGGVLVHMLTGAPPFSGSKADLFRQHLRSTPPALRARGLNASDPLEDVVERCLAKAPQDRFDSAGDLLAALRACPEWQGEPAGTGALALESVRPPPDATPSPRRWRAAMLVLPSLMASAYLAAWAASPPETPWVDMAAKRISPPPAEPVRQPAVAAPTPRPQELTPAAAPAPPATPPRRRRRPKRSATVVEPGTDWTGSSPCDPIKDPWAHLPAIDTVP